MDLSFLDRLLSTPSVSGMESHAGSLFLEYVAPYVDSSRTDFLGNVYATAINGCEHVNRLKVLLEAHIDEIGFQVVYIDDDGYIYIRQNGGVDVQCIPGSQVIIQTSQGDEIDGIIGKKPMHITDPEERRKSLELHTLWVDTGLPSDDVRNKVSIGDFVSWKSNVIHLSDKRISSKGLDNKVGVYIVSQVLRKLSSNKDISYDVVGVASVQEEVGHRGAIACGYNIKPDIVICIDVDFATDVPNCPKSRFGSVSLGKGVIIHKSIDTNAPLVTFTEHLAKDNNIRHQVSARPFAVGGTNTNVLQLSQGGVKTLSLGIPCRYMHTPVELCDLEDVHSAIDLISNLVVSTERLYNKTF